MLRNWELPFIYTLLKRILQCPWLKQKAEDKGERVDWWKTVPEKAGQDEIQSTSRHISHREERRLVGVEAGRSIGLVSKSDSLPLPAAFHFLMMQVLGLCVRVGVEA